MIQTVLFPTLRYQISPSYRLMELVLMEWVQA